MIINNLIIGMDSLGNKLECGNICTYKFKNKDNELVQMKGIIVYDESTFSFAFEQLDDNYPILLMHHAEYGSIIKRIDVRSLDIDYPNAEKWIEIYNNNLLKAKLD